MHQKTVIVNYGMGNLNSVYRIVNDIKGDAVVSSNPEDILGATKIILPGVGHFGKAVANLEKLNIWDTLNVAVLEKKIPILGICLGMQLMVSHSEEGDAKGFNWFDANIVKFKVRDHLQFKVPQMGWNNLIIENESPLFNGIPGDALYFFIHSYHIKCNNKEDILAKTEYDYFFTSAIHKNNIFGTQFHPEKSHDSGKKLLCNFLNL